MLVSGEERGEVSRHPVPSLANWNMCGERLCWGRAGSHTINVTIQHIFSVTELNRISPTYYVSDCWLMFKSRDVISTLIKVNPWGGAQQRARHLTVLTLTPVHCVVVWGSALPPHYLLYCRKTGDSLPLPPSLSLHLTSDGWRSWDIVTAGIRVGRGVLGWSQD